MMMHPLFLLLRKKPVKSTASKPSGAITKFVVFGIGHLLLKFTEKVVYNQSSRKSGNCFMT